MTEWLRIGGLALLALIALWVVLEIVSLVLGFLTWAISLLVSIVVVALLLAGAYYLLTDVLGVDLGI
ncbi:hypothetical protein OB919_18140 [Halobacteria archaeon AArc-curdl1]|uniref:Uncharacterized protein n=1 Tax=Natronosalvus hydrolyticus TaxID=2979988 RepID=A0AAP2ZAZ7_9EURY|nr:hypothetical protein [Halobacteria archaeon AArc-curdl1]